MKRKGLFFSVLVIMVIAMISASIIACENEKDNSDESSGGTYSNASIEGTWTGKQQGYDSSYTINFNKDGTGTYLRKTAKSGSGSGYYTHSGSFSYIMTSNNSGMMIARLHYSNNPSENDIEMFSFAMSDNKIYMMEGEEGVVLSNNSNDGEDKKTVVGIWTGREEDYDSSYTISFTEDGTGTYLRKTASSGSGSGYYTHSGSFSYIMTSNNSGMMIARLHYSDNPSENDIEMFSFAMSDNKIYMMEGEEGVALTKQ